MSESGGYHDHVNEYKFTFELKQKANGEYQTLIKVRGNEGSALVDVAVKCLDDLNSVMTTKGYKLVKPVGAD